MNGGSSRTGLRRYAPLVLIACLWAARAVALIPPATIDRIVGVKIQKAEIVARRQSGEINHRTARGLFRPLEEELNGLYRELRALSRDERRQADRQIEALMKVRLATLKPQWEARGAKFQQQQAQRDRTITDAMMRDVRTAVEVQQQRLLLQERRDRGAIGDAEFAAEDKRAVDQIMAMRGRYAAEGENYAKRFDREVKNKTAAMARNPRPVQDPRPPPKRRGEQKAQPVAVAAGGSFDADVRAAVKLRHRRILLQQQRMRGEISEAEFAAQDKKALGQIMAVLGKYRRRVQSEWERFYRELEAKTWKDPRNPPPQAPADSGGTTPADYERDVDMAARLMRLRKENSSRYSGRGAMNVLAMGEADKPLFLEWWRLREKWHAEGSGLEFDRDIGQRSGLPVMPMPYVTPSTTPLRMFLLRVSHAVMQVITALTILIPLGALLYALYRVSRRGKKEPGDRRSLLWYAPPLAVVWLWTGLVGYWPSQRAPYGVAVIDGYGVFAIGLTLVLFLFYRRSRKKDAQPARLKSIFWFAPAAVALWAWAAPVAYLPFDAAVAIVARRVFVVLAVTTGFYLLLRLFRRRPVAPRQTSTTYGSAQYFPFLEDIPDKYRSLLIGGVFLGKSSAPDRSADPLEAPGAPIVSIKEHHVLIVARTRTGKGTRVIVPTLLRYPGSALVIDPKGENAAITARTRRDQLRQRVYVLNPWNMLDTDYEDRGITRATYNPLDILDRNDPNAVAIAQTLAAAICPAPPNSKDHFWQGSAANVLTAVLLWLAESLGEEKTLARAREIVSLSRKQFTNNFLIPMAASGAFAGAIRELAAPYIDMAQETYSGVMANLSEATKFLSDPQIKEATRTSSFSMQELADEMTTLYVVIPPERMDTQRMWLRLVIAAAMHIFKNHSGRRGKFNHRCLFLIDEFAALGRLDDLPRDIATMSGFGVDFALIIQGLDQLKDHYGDARGAILSNCAFKWFCNVNDLESAKYLSETLGKATVETTSTSESFSSGGQSSSHSRSTSHGETGRALLTPDEVLNLGKGVAICIHPGGHAFYLRPVDYWDLLQAFDALRQRHQFLYWDPLLTYDDNPYFTAEPAGHAGGNGQDRPKLTPAYDPTRPIADADPATAALNAFLDADPFEIDLAKKTAEKIVEPYLDGSTRRSQEQQAVLTSVLEKLEELKRKPPP